MWLYQDPALTSLRFFKIGKDLKNEFIYNQIFFVIINTFDQVHKLEYRFAKEKNYGIWVVTLGGMVFTIGSRIVSDAL